MNLKKRIMRAIKVANQRVIASGSRRGLMRYAAIHLFLQMTLDNYCRKGARFPYSSKNHLQIIAPHRHDKAGMVTQAIVEPAITARHRKKIVILITAHRYQPHEEDSVDFADELYDQAWLTRNKKYKIYASCHEIQNFLFGAAA